jgi:hypothetical protein
LLAGIGVEKESLGENLDARDGFDQWSWGFDAACELDLHSRVSLMEGRHSNRTLPFSEML